jgi:hypothetical protein
MKEDIMAIATTLVEKPAAARHFVLNPERALAPGIPP